MFGTLYIRYNKYVTILLSVDSVVIAQQDELWFDSSIYIIK